MKHISTLIFALFCAAAIIVAQPAKSKKKTTAKTTPPAKTEVQKATKAEDKGVAKVMGGTIVAIDATKNSITVSVKSKDYTVLIVSQTALVAMDNKISFVDLIKGDYVTINYLKFQNGERQAEKINNKTFAAKLEKFKSKPETQAVTSQQKETKTQPKTQKEPAKKKEIKAEPKSESKPAQKKEKKLEVK